MEPGLDVHQQMSKKENVVQENFIQPQRRKKFTGNGREKNVFLLGKWMDLAIIMLSKRSQMQTDKYIM